MDINRYAIGCRIRNIRKYLGMPQEVLAVRCGRTIAYIKSIEDGQSRLSVKTLVILSEALGVTADYILRGERPLIYPRFHALSSIVKSKHD